MLPMRFRYEKGMISELEFEERDQPWSANIKRAIVNMLQVNLQKKARTDQAEISRLLRDNEPSTPKNDFFTTQEVNFFLQCSISQYLEKSTLSRSPYMTKIDDLFTSPLCA